MLEHMSPLAPDYRLRGNDGNGGDDGGVGRMNRETIVQTLQARVPNLLGKAGFQALGVVVIERHGPAQVLRRLAGLCHGGRQGGVA